MFNKLKQFKDLRHKAKELEKTLSEEKISVDKDGIIIEMDGNQRITKLEIPSAFFNASKKTELEKTLSDLITKCLEKTKTVMAQKLRKMEDFDLSKFGLK